MAEEGKKISFGFSKSLKKSVLQNSIVPQEKKVDFIDCLDGKSIKVIGGEAEKEGPKVIPMLGGKTWHDRITNKTDADIYEPKLKKVPPTVIKQETSEDTSIQNGHGSNKSVPMEVTEIKKEPISLEELAAQELMEDTRNEIKQDEIKKDFTLPLTDNADLIGAKESTLEDYEQTPIQEYGEALLRGMGWKEGKAIGKNEKGIEPQNPEDRLRPRGMGLGADKVTSQKLSTKPKTKEEEQLTMVVGAFVKIIAGKHNNSYGQLEGFDEGAGRLIVKLALGGNSISLIEGLVEPVTKTEYLKNSKVLNASKYEEYKNKSSKEKSVKTEKKKTNHDSADENSGSDCRSRKRKSSSGSEEDYREKKSKKKHKRKERESSKYSSGKSKNKNKDRERTRDRKSRYSRSPDRTRNDKKHKRSRS